jgi:hypothetical protein
VSEGSFREGNATYRHKKNLENVTKEIPVTKVIIFGS